MSDLSKPARVPWQGNAMEVTVVGPAVARKSQQADKLSTPRLIKLTGQAEGEVEFDGSQDIEIPVTVTVAAEAITTEEIDETISEIEGGDKS